MLTSATSASYESKVKEEKEEDKEGGGGSSVCSNLHEPVQQYVERPVKRLG